MELVMCELFINTCRHDLIHTLNNFCLFDDCADLSAIGEGIKQGYVCQHCIAQLKTHNVSDPLIRDLTSVLHWCRRNTIVIINLTQGLNSSILVL